MDKEAFTLVELLIVVSIIGILAGVAIAVINPNKVRGRARDGVRKNDMAVIKSAIENYYAENNIYPATGTIPFGGVWANYLKLVPQDPLIAGGASWVQYCYASIDANNFILCAKVEDSNSAYVPSGASPCGGIAVTEAYCAQNPF